MSEVEKEIVCHVLIVFERHDLSLGSFYGDSEFNRQDLIIDFKYNKRTVGPNHPE